MRTKNTVSLITILVSSIFISFQTENVNEVKIGDQIWKTENLDVDHFQNGDLIKEAKSKEEWVKATTEKTPVWCYYNQKHKGFGKLYNWYVINDKRKIASKGWHVPSYDEWQKLKALVGGDNEGISLMSKKEWPKGKDSYKFNALPSNHRDYNGEFYTDSSFSMICAWWSSTSCSIDSAWGRGLVDYGFSGEDCYKYGYGLSVRLIKD